jgi:tetratricopeptide (TPR) repeat protein
MRFSYLFIALFCWLSSVRVSGTDLISDTSTLDKLRVGINQVYNAEFDAAEYTVAYLQESYPSHPVTPFFEGMIYYWKYYPLIPDGPGANEFETVMKETWEKAQVLKERGNVIEGVFFELISRSFIVMYYADNGRSSKAISHLGKIYRDIVASFELKEKFIEYYFITGLYNYYREAYPEHYPVYKPVTMFFRKGDKKRGLEMLRYAANETYFMHVEAALFLSLIYINFEHDVDSAVSYAARLHQNFPDNGYFLSKYTEMLLIDHQFERALDPILSLMSLDDYNKIKGTIYMGIYEEKMMNNTEKSRMLYEEGIRLAEAFDERAKYIRAYAYLGLSRYYFEKGDNKRARAYRKKAKVGNSSAYFF